MKNASYDIAAAAAMLERARQVLELTYHDWRLYERPPGRGKAARKQQNRPARHDLNQGFSGVGQSAVQAYA